MSVEIIGKSSSNETGEDRRHATHALASSIAQRLNINPEGKELILLIDTSNAHTNLTALINTTYRLTQHDKLPFKQPIVDRAQSSIEQMLENSQP